MVYKLVVDTCVWLDLAKDYQEQPVVGALENLINGHEVELVVPQIILEEFKRNKARVNSKTQRSLQSHFRLVRDAVTRFGDDASKAETLMALDEVDHKIVVDGEAVNDSIERIQNLLKSATILATTDAIKQRVTERVITNRAPYHRGRNSVGDDILLEAYVKFYPLDT